MATYALTPGAPTRAPAFPSHVPLEDASEQLEALGGALDVLAFHLDSITNVGTSTPLAAYAAGHTVARVRDTINETIKAMLVYQNAMEGR